MTKQLKIAIQWLVTIIIAITITFFIKAFVVQSFLVQTNAMENNYRFGDHLFVEKYSLGARFELPFIDIDYSKALRLPEIGKLQNNDVLVFNNPKQREEVLISRCVAIPGDTICMKDKQVFVNNIEIDIPGVKYVYRAQTSKGKLDSAFFAEYNVSDFIELSPIGLYNFLATKDQADTILTNDRIDNVRLHLNKNKKRSIDSFDEIILPYAGYTIELNDKNRELYLGIIHLFEGVKQDVSLLSSFTFTQDYYYMLDDNRDLSNDSRSWGMLPENYIIGKVKGKWYYSND